MKRIFILFLIVLFLVIGCNKEDNNLGDINYNKDVSMNDIISYDIYTYHIDISAPSKGKAYNNSLFTYLLDNNGMYVINYVGIYQNIISRDDYNTYSISNKEYLYKVTNNYLDIVYIIDDSYYLSISVENLIENIDLNSIEELMNQLDFEVTVK